MSRPPPLVDTPLSGWAADRFGTKRLYMTAIALFTLGSALCATAWDINSLILFRVLVLVACTLVPAFLLPRKHEESHLLDDEEGVPPVVMH